MILKSATFSQHPIICLSQFVIRLLFNAKIHWLLVHLIIISSFDEGIYCPLIIICFFKILSQLFLHHTCLNLNFIKYLYRPYSRYSFCSTISLDSSFSHSDVIMIIYFFKAIGSLLIHLCWILFGFFITLRSFDISLCGGVPLMLNYYIYKSIIYNFC